MSDPERVAVLGVSPGDSWLRAGVWEHVPEDADAVYRPGFRSAPAGRALAALVRNPPVVATDLARGALRRLRAGSPPPATRALEELAAEHDLPLVDLELGAFHAVRTQDAGWTAVAWLTTLLAAAVLALVLAVAGLLPVDRATLVGAVPDAVVAFVPEGVDPGLLALALGLIAVGVAAGVVLAFAGDRVRRRDEALADAVLARAAERGDERPVVVVRARQAEGLARELRERGVAVGAARIGAELAAAR